MIQSFTDSLTSVSISHSYETIASILGPSNSALVKVDHQPRPIEAVTSMDLKDKSVTHSDEFVSHFTDNIAPIQKIKGHFEDNKTKHSTEYPSSAEPFMSNLVGDHVSPSKTTNSDEDFVCASIKKWPPLTEADFTEISKEDGDKVEEQEVSLDQCHTKERTLTGQDSVYIECLLTKQQTEAEQDEVKTVLSSLQLDTW